jgi:hypothetical protein
LDSRKYTVRCFPKQFSLLFEGLLIGINEAMCLVYVTGIDVINHLLW